VTQADVNSGLVQNQATVNGTAPGAVGVSDVSHATDPNADAPTITLLPANPQITLIKQFTGFADVNFNGMTDVNDLANYSFTIANSGNLPLNGITVSDPVLGAVVVGGPIALAPGASDSASFSASLPVTQLHINAGQISNTATVSGNPPAGLAVDDESHPTNPALDGPTLTPVPQVARLGLIKRVSGIADTNANLVTDEGDTISYVFDVSNTGNVAVTNVTLTELLPGAVVAGGPILTLNVGATDSTSFTASYIIQPSDMNNGFVSNSVRADGFGPGAVPATDLSDDNSFTEDQPTVTPLLNAPAIAIVKTVAGVDDLNFNGFNDTGDRIRYRFDVRNTGNRPLSNVYLTDPLTPVLPLPPTGIALAVGETNSASFTAAYLITPADMVRGYVDNTATAFGTAPDNSIVQDDSDPAVYTGTAPTRFVLTPFPAISVIKRFNGTTDTNGNGFIDPLDIIHYQIFIANTGNVVLTNITLTDSLPLAVITDQPGQLDLDPGETDSTHYSVAYTVTVGDATAGTVTNQVTATGTTPAPALISDNSDEASFTGNDPTVTAVMLTPPILTKVAGKSEVRRGEIVPYTIRASNLTNNNFFLRDIMPPGFSFVDGSATANSIAIVPGITGRTLTFTGLAADVTGAVTLKLKLLAGTTLSTGRFTNNAELVHSLAGTVLARAQANVIIREEHVFDCGEVIGRVFDDLNGNGYADTGEPGLPSVRVVTVKGLIITTDKDGRFHVPCADVPNGEIGSTFIMKLDPRSLPTGYRITSENPRDVRLTRGKVTKLNFGASGSRAVRLDVKRDAFVGATLDLKPQWAAGLDRLTSILAKSNGDLDLVYGCTKYAPLADQRLAAVETIIQSKWRESGAARRLHIIARVECGK
jgi:uncharacterized repeat protein (TIGR01451 family)